jgi:anti-sigma B factor antagonist
MNFSIESLTTFAIVRSHVEKLDASNATELKEEFNLLLQNNTNTILFDLTKTRYCDSSGLSVVLFANRMCRDTNGRFVLSGLQENVFKMIKIAQLDKVLSIYENIHDATESLV